MLLPHRAGPHPTPRHRRATRPYNLVNLVNRENPAHVLLLATGLARDRPSPYGYICLSLLGEGQALALRGYRCVAGTGPRPTGISP